MSDSGSSTRAEETSPLLGEMSKGGSGSSSRVPKAAVADDQATVITNLAPMPPQPVSESAARILQGKIQPGDRLGHFELLQYVGGGGMGRVFRAHDTRLARTVALKVLSPDQASDRETVLRFQNEAQSAARLDHDNVARVYYVGEDCGLHYIVFEFVEGVNVRELVEAKGPLPLDEAIAYTLQVADALAHAASRNVVHRDIKPSNMLIAPGGQVKLIDMGLARLREADAVAADLTASGVTLGTFDYISPEQARDPRNADVRSDIYSLGCTFFFMLTGRPPFLGGTMLQKLLQHQADEPPDVRQFRPDLPDEVMRVLRVMLAKDPARRYRNPAELVNDLLELARDVGLDRVTGGTRAWIVPEPAPVSALYRHLPWLVPLVTLIIIVVVLDFVWSHSTTQETRLTAPPAETYRAPETPEVGLRPDIARWQPGSTLPDASSPTARTDLPPPFGEPSFLDALKDSSLKPEFGSESPTPGSLGLGAGLTPGVPTLGETQFPNATPRLDDNRAVASNAATNAARAKAQNSDLLIGEAALTTRPATTTATGVKPAVKRTGVLVVRPGTRGKNEFATLQAACNVAATGDVIELAYNGLRPEPPVHLAKVRVTIRAADGYQPVVVFQPGEFDDTFESSRSMITVSDGRLSLFNLAVQMVLPRETPADGWSLVEMTGNSLVRLDRCSLTIRNASDQLTAYHKDVAFFRVRSDVVAMMDDTASLPTEPAGIELMDTIARGEAVLLRSEDSQPVRLTWDNGLLVTTERLLSASSGSKSPQTGETVRLDLRHLTAIMQKGLGRLTCSQIRPHHLTAQIDCVDSLLVTAPGNVLIEQIGDDGLNDFRQRIVWNGERNFYEGFKIFWAVRRSAAEEPLELMTLDAWRAYWGPEHENLSKSGRVYWRQQPAVGMPMDSHTVADYELNEVASNPVIGMARDGRNAGCLSERLPTFPPAPSTGRLPSTKPLAPKAGTDPVRPLRNLPAAPEGATSRRPR